MPKFFSAPSCQYFASGTRIIEDQPGVVQRTACKENQPDEPQRDKGPRKVTHIALTSRSVRFILISLRQFMSPTPRGVSALERPGIGPRFVKHRTPDQQSLRGKNIMETRQDGFRWPDRVSLSWTPSLPRIGMVGIGGTCAAAAPSSAVTGSTAEAVTQQTFPQA